ncbi:hypothetical protein VTN00DRAFT_6635 [Thermoascus crustaceus]|uniref:uncharacterized protein n=1 Tax=Thermoascus crustaceus TaxID=5088 RepID=UPI003744841A
MFDLPLVEDLKFECEPLFCGMHLQSRHPDTEPNFKETTAEDKSSTESDIIHQGSRKVEMQHECVVPSNTEECLYSIWNQPNEKAWSIVDQTAAEYKKNDMSDDVSAVRPKTKDQNQAFYSERNTSEAKTDAKSLIEETGEEDTTPSQSAIEEEFITIKSVEGLSSNGVPCSCPTSPVQSPCSMTSEGLSIHMSLAKRELVDRLMLEFYSMFDPNSGVVSRVGPSSSSCSQSAGASQQATTCSGGGKGKRKTSDENALTRDDNSGEDLNKRPKYQHDAPGAPSGMEKKFACPYFKRNPLKYQRVRSCPGPGWHTVHRMKEHLYRRHALPIRCPRCYQSFKSDEALKNHQRAPQSCEVCEEDTIEGFDKEQEKKLKSRKRSSLKQSEEDRWREVYRILFPDDLPSSIPSPYYDYDLAFKQLSAKSPESAAFTRHEEFLSRELPREVRRELELATERELEPIEERLKGRLVDIVRTCQERRLYQNSLEPSRETDQPVIANGTGNTQSGQLNETPTEPPSEPFGSRETTKDLLAPFQVPPCSTLYSLSDFEDKMVDSAHYMENGKLSDSGYDSNNMMRLLPSGPFQAINGISDSDEEACDFPEGYINEMQSSTFPQASSCFPGDINEGIQTTNDTQYLTTDIDESNDKGKTPVR